MRRAIRRRLFCDGTEKSRLENYFQTKLNDSRIVSRQNLTKTGRTHIRTGIGEVYPVEGIEEFRAKRKRHFLSNRG